MAELTLTQFAVTSAATPLCTLQPGSTVVLCASAATNIGTSNGVTTSTGFALPANTPVPITYPDEEGSGPVTLFGITASTSNVSAALTI